MRMRLSILPVPALFLLAGVATPASARPKAKAAAPVESAAARAARLAAADDVGERKDADLHAPLLTNAQIATGEATAPERGPADATAQPVRPVGALSGALEDLVARQLSRNHAVEGQLDKCLADARARDPHLADVEVTVRIVDKNARFEAPEHADAQLTSCLGAVRGLKLSMPDQAFPWRFSGPSVATAGAGDHREMATR